MARIDFNLSTETVTSEDGIVTIGDANGALQVGQGSGIVASAASGMIRWNGTNLQVSNGTTWLNITATSGASGSVTAEEAFAVAVALS